MTRCFYEFRPNGWENTKFPHVKMYYNGIKTFFDLRYTDSKGGQWDVPEGSFSDGASIPRFFWRVIGSPLRGRYNFPAIFHDYYCDVRGQLPEEQGGDRIPHEKVHWMFYDACLANGVGKRKAKIMYWAVKRFGPKW